MANGCVIGSNTKYGSRNPLARALIDGFVRNLERLVTRSPFASAADVGCGEGVLLGRLRHCWEGKRLVAVDVDPREAGLVPRNAPTALVGVASAYDLPFRAGAFDLVVCSEVLEHLARPDAALEELRRVAKGAAVLCVPDEPLWRALNLVRGAYWTALGNTPGHLNHWSARAFARYVGPWFEVREVVRSLPWTLLLCRRRGDR